jgi:hypothetical protein
LGSLVGIFIGTLVYLYWYIYRLDWDYLVKIVVHSNIIVPTTPTAAAAFPPSSIDVNSSGDHTDKSNILPHSNDGTIGVEQRAPLLSSTNGGHSVSSEHNHAASPAY